MTTPLQSPAYLHLIVECHGCPYALIDDVAIIRKLLRSAAAACSLHIIREASHRFQPRGITGYVLLQESHISIHTWPESGFAVVDILSCGELDRERLADCFRTLLPAQMMIRELRGPMPLSTPDSAGHGSVFVR
jgi:S-adenosylmethionine decarboxylase proenzyme